MHAARPVITIQISQHIDSNDYRQAHKDEACNANMHKQSCHTGERWSLDRLRCQALLLDDLHTRRSRVGRVRVFGLLIAACTLLEGSLVLLEVRAVVLGANNGDDEHERGDDADEDALHRCVVGHDFGLAVLVYHSCVQIIGTSCMSRDKEKRWKVEREEPQGRGSADRQLFAVCAKEERYSLASICAEADETICACEMRKLSGFRRSYYQEKECSLTLPSW